MAALTADPLTPTSAPLAAPVAPRSTSPRSDDTDSDGPLSPDLCDIARAPASPPAAPARLTPDAPERVLRAWSPGKTARAAARENAVLATEGLSPARAKRARAGGDAMHAEIISMPDAEVYDSDSDDDDGYARGTVFSDEEAGDHADEDDDLFITPGRPETARARYAASPTAAGLADDGRATFDPVLALLDDNWHLLGLDETDDDATPERGARSPSPVADELPPHLAPIADSLRALVRDGAVAPAGDARRWRAEAEEAERQLMEALRDADELDSSRERYVRECDLLRAQLRAKEAKVVRLTRENEMAAREIAVITEGMATLTAAHDVDVRINELLIADQAEEIRSLRKKLELERCRVVPKSASENGSEIASRSTSPADSPIASPVGSTGSIGRCRVVCNDDEEFEGSSGRSSSSSLRRTVSSPRSIGRRTSSTSSASSGGKRRSEFRAKERENLVQRKQAMFKNYERRHSMPLQQVVRRASQLTISSRNRAERGERETAERQAEPKVAGKRETRTRSDASKRPGASS